MSEYTVVSREYVRWLREQRRAWIARGLTWKGEEPAADQPAEETQP